MCEKYDINKVATAHNRNDNAETLLMNFMRGSTTNGLCGIPYVRGNIIRPILNVSRDEIEKYCKTISNVKFIDATTGFVDS